MDYSFFDNTKKNVTIRRLSKDMLMAYANYFRDSRKIRYELPIFDIVEEYHQNGLLNLQVVENGLLENLGHEGLYCLNDNTIYIPERVYIGAKEGNKRDRFTLTHEFAHYLLSYVLGFEIKVVERRILAFENPEWQANFLASELLVPTMEMMDVDGIYYIEDVYEVSNTVARIAYKKGKIQKDILENPYSLYRKRIWINPKKQGFPDSNCTCMVKYYDKYDILRTKPANYNKKDNEFVIINEFININHKKMNICIYERNIIKYAYVIE